MAQLATLGLPQAATRFLAAEPTAEMRGRLRGWLIRRGALCAVPAGMLGAGLAAAASGRRAELVAGAGIAAASCALALVSQGVLAGLQDFRRLAWLAAVSAIVQLGAVALLAHVGGPGGALVGFALAQLILGSALRRPGGGGSGASEVPRVRTYAFNAWLATAVSLFAWSRFELFFLERSAGAGAVAMFSIAVTISQLAVQPVTLLGGALVPHLAELSGGRVIALRDETYAAATRLCAFVAFPVCFGLAAAAPVLVPLVYGAAFQEGTGPTAVVAAAAALGAGATALLYAMDRPQFIAWGGLVIAAVATGVYAIVIPRGGLMGAAAARGAVQALAVAAGTLYIGLRMGVRVPLGSIARGACAAALAAIPGAAIVHAGGARWAILGAALAVSGLVYVPLARALRVLGPGDVSYLDTSIVAWPAFVRVPARALLGASARRRG
jgi:O-antigen/teichoic acid export membrane protein